MSRPKLEVADVFHHHGDTWRRANAGHVSLGQLKVMAAIEHCRSAALGGHVERCEDCGHSRIAYNSCRNRLCPKCQGAAAKDWLAARQADLLPVGYFHLVFTLPAELAPIAYQNKAVLYDLLFRTAAETLLTIAVDPKHLGARIGATAVLHSWGSAMTHHPHLHMIVPGGGISLDGSRWVRCRPGFLLPVRVLSRLFRRLFLAGLADAHTAGRLAFFGELDGLRNRAACAAYLAPLRKKNWFVYAKPPFAGPEAVLAYLARYTHRVAISNSRLVALDERGVTFRFKDYRRNGQARYRTMTLAPDEFIRRFLLHVLPKGFHRIRHYGLPATAACRVSIARARELLAAPMPSTVVLERLVTAGRSGLSALHFAGVGSGIAVSAALVAAMLLLGHGWRSLWLASGALSLAALLAVAILLPDRAAMPAPVSARGGDVTGDASLLRLIVAYGLFGFGYIITTTFLVTIVRITPLIRGLEPLIWIVFGLAAAPSVPLWAWIARRFGISSALAFACVIEAAGVLASVAWETASGVLAAAILVGGTFMGITALGLIQARALATGEPRRALALMTGSFGLGQIVGPAFAGILSDSLGSFTVPSVVAAVALFVAAALVRN